MRLIACIAIISAFLFCLPCVGHTASGPQMTDYCATPPFLVQAVPPNIMIVIDMSGSMQFPAHGPEGFTGYSNEVAQCGSHNTTYDGTKEYYGYFKTDKFYQYGSNKFTENGDCTEAQRNTPSEWSSTKIPGNLLNWATMSRMDILRKVLIGGKSVSHQLNAHTLLSEGGTWEYTDSNLKCTFSVSGGTTQAHTITVTDCCTGTCPFTLSGANVKVDVPETERVGVVQEIADRDYDNAWDQGAPRFGIMVYRDDATNNIGRIVAGVGDSSLESFLNDMQNEKPYWGTPTGEAIINALDYYKHTQSTCTYSPNNAYMSDSKDPWDEKCQLSFILLVSDGEWNGSVDPVVPARQGRIGTFDGSNYDLRDDLDDKQVVTTYTVYAFSDSAQGRNALQQTAIYGGFTDKDNDYWPYPYSAYPTDSKNVTLPNPSCDPAGTWNETCLEWDESKDGIPDNYYSATEGETLRDKITEAIFDMMKRASSGTSVSVLSTSAEGEGSLFQAYFNYKVESGMRTVYWAGYLNGLWIDQYGNIREDTVQDQALVLTDDYIIEFFVDTDGVTKIKRYEDFNGNGVIDTDEYQNTIQIADLNPIWEGGKKLALRDDTTAARTIYTYVDADNDQVVDSGEFGSNKFVTTQATTLQPYLNASSSTNAQDIIKFIRGQYVFTMRERRLTVGGQTDKIWKLGDITYSTPVAVGAPMMKYHIIYGDSTYHKYYNDYKNRRIVVYSGANDGMLHAFNAGFYHEGDDSSTTDTDKIERGWYSDPADTKANNADIGKELWAYIPYNLLPHLKWLTTSNYCHVYYVDLKPRVVDARIFTPDATHPYGWGTILIGGMRLGGGKMSLTKSFSGLPSATRVFRSAYFAIDITNPLAPNLLWEFWDKTDTTNSHLGFTSSYPTVMRVGPRDQAGNWYVIFGSGIATGVGTQAGDGSTATRYVYILDLMTGSLLRKVDMASIDSGISGKKVFMADPITVDLAVDYQVDKGYIGATYYNAGWLGKMYRININEDTAPNNWTFSTFMSLDKPVTAAPSASVDLYDRLWIYFGTGRYFNDADRSDTSAQRLVGVWDPGTGTVDLSTNLNDVTNVHVYEDGYVDVNNDKTYDYTFNQYLTVIRNEYSSGSKNGWYLTMSGGERSLHKPTILGGIVLFPTFKPTTDLCGYGGTSYLYALYYETGTANEEPVIDLGTDTITVGYKTYREILRKTTLGSGMPTHAVIHSGQEKGVVGLIQLGTGVIKKLSVSPAFSPKSQTLFWEERK